MMRSERWTERAFVALGQEVHVNCFERRAAGQGRAATASCTLGKGTVAKLSARGDGPMDQRQPLPQTEHLFPGTSLPILAVLSSPLQRIHYLRR